MSEAESTIAAIHSWLAHQLTAQDVLRRDVGEPGGDVELIVRGTGLECDPRITISDEARTDLSPQDAITALVNANVIVRLQKNPCTAVHLDNFGNVTP